MAAASPACTAAAVAAADAPRRGLLCALFSRRNMVAVAVGLTTRAAAPGLGLLPAVAAALVGRLVYSKSEQRVPFTCRTHVILLPSVAEAALGAVLYEKFLAEQAAKRTLLDRTHPDNLLVTGVAQRLIAALGEGHGGGYQKHLRSFRWEVTVVNSQVMNAFVFPGGKICVYTGLLQLLNRDPDLLAMVMGHEIAHALARHSTEKMGMGLGVSVALSLLQMALTANSGQQAAAEAERRRAAVAAEEARARRAYKRQYSQRLVPGDSDSESETDRSSKGGSERQQQQHQRRNGGGGLGDGLLRAAAAGGAPNAAAATRAPAGPRYGSGGGGGGAAPRLPVWMSEDLMQRLAAVLLELPFSRRAETEADLIGLKLMALAGFNASRGPEAFRLLAQASGDDRKRHAGEALIAGLGCTHPDSQRRADLLARELAWMSSKGQGRGGAGLEAIGTKVDYWSV